MPISIPDLYKYAQLATAGYVDFSGAPNLLSDELRNRAAAQRRIPTSLGNALFPDSGGWQVAGDPRYSVGSHTDTTSGFAATLFQKGNEKVLSIRGTDPQTEGQVYQDLLQADISEIGLLGIAITQTVSLVNLVLRMQATQGVEGVTQFVLHESLTLPNGVSNYVQFTLAGPEFTKYYWLDINANGVGAGGITASDQITVVGHSLGGHLAAMAHRLFPQIFGQAVIFNSARHNPVTSQALTNQFLNLFVPWGFTPAPSFSNVQMFDSEDQAPADDASVVSSMITG
jgi:hypothetical protein